MPEKQTLIRDGLASSDASALSFSGIYSFEVLGTPAKKFGFDWGRLVVVLHTLHIICSTVRKSTACMRVSLSLCVKRPIHLLIFCSSIHLGYVSIIDPSSLVIICPSLAYPTHPSQPSLHSFIQISIPPSQYWSTHRHSSILYEYIYPTMRPSFPPSFLLPPLAPYPSWNDSTARLNTLHYLLCPCTWTHTCTRADAKAHRHHFHSSLSNSNGPGETVQSS